MFLACSTILEDYKAQEIAEDYGCSEEEAAKMYFAEIAYESGFDEETTMTHSQFVDNIDDELELYYNYGAGYYFCVKNVDDDVVEESKKIIVRLTESELKKVIKESVKKCLVESMKQYDI